MNMNVDINNNNNCVSHHVVLHDSIIIKVYKIFCKLLYIVFFACALLSVVVIFFALLLKSFGPYESDILKKYVERFINHNISTFHMKSTIDKAYVSWNVDMKMPTITLRNVEVYDISEANSAKTPSSLFTASNIDIGFTSLITKDIAKSTFTILINDCSAYIKDVQTKTNEAFTLKDQIAALKNSIMNTQAMLSQLMRKFPIDVMFKNFHLVRDKQSITINNLDISTTSCHSDVPSSICPPPRSLLNKDDDVNPYRLAEIYATINVPYLGTTKIKYYFVVDDVDGDLDKRLRNMSDDKKMTQKAKSHLSMYVSDVDIATIYNNVIKDCVKKSYGIHNISGLMSGTFNVVLGQGFEILHTRFDISSKKVNAVVRTMQSIESDWMDVLGIYDHSNNSIIIEYGTIRIPKKNNNDKDGNDKFLKKKLSAQQFSSYLNFNLKYNFDNDSAIGALWIDNTSLSIDDVLKYWPSDASVIARLWTKDHVKSATLSTMHLDFSHEKLQTVFSGMIEFHDVDMREITDISAISHLKARKLDLQISPNSKITFFGHDVELGDIKLDKAAATITNDTQPYIDINLTLSLRDMMAKIFPEKCIKDKNQNYEMALICDTPKANQVVAEIRIPLISTVTIDDMRIDLYTSISDIKFSRSLNDPLWANFKEIKSPKLDIVIKDGLLKIVGDIVIDDVINANMTVTKDLDDKIAHGQSLRNITIEMHRLSPQALKKVGIDIIRYVSGNINAMFVASRTKNNLEYDVYIDLTNTKINVDALPNINKQMRDKGIFTAKFIRESNNGVKNLIKIISYKMQLPKLNGHGVGSITLKGQGEMILYADYFKNNVKQKDNKHVVTPNAEKSIVVSQSGTVPDMKLCIDTTGPKLNISLASQALDISGIDRSNLMRELQMHKAKFDDEHIAINVYAENVLLAHQQKMLRVSLNLEYDCGTLTSLTTKGFFDNGGYFSSFYDGDTLALFSNNAGSLLRTMGMTDKISNGLIDLRIDMRKDVINKLKTSDKNGGVAVVSDEKIQKSSVVENSNIEKNIDNDVNKEIVNNKDGYVNNGMSVNKDDVSDKILNIKFDKDIDASGSIQMQKITIKDLPFITMLLKLMAISSNFTEIANVLSGNELNFSNITCDIIRYATVPNILAIRHCSLRGGAMFAKGNGIINIDDGRYKFYGSLLPNNIWNSTLMLIGKAVPQISDAALNDSRDSMNIMIESDVNGEVKMTSNPMSILMPAPFGKIFGMPKS